MATQGARRCGPGRRYSVPDTSQVTASTIGFAADGNGAHRLRGPPNAIEVDSRPQRLHRAESGLTNGLLAIVASDWPGEELLNGQQTKPASKLIQLVKSKIDSDQWLVLEPPPFPPDEPAIRVEVDLTVLRRALDEPPRV
jgi:hypothetical protein